MEGVAGDRSWGGSGVRNRCKGQIQIGDAGWSIIFTLAQFVISTNLPWNCPVLDQPVWVWVQVYMDEVGLSDNISKGPGPRDKGETMNFNFERPGVHSIL